LCDIKGDAIALVLDAPSQQLTDHLQVVTEDAGPLPASQLGVVDFGHPDPTLDKIVSSMMNAITSDRAALLGLPTSPPLPDCIRE
jgi:hypothetical protein